MQTTIVRPGIVHVTDVASELNPSRTHHVLKLDLDAVATLTAQDCTNPSGRDMFDTKVDVRFSRKWYGGIESTDEARELFSRGWAEGAARARAKVDEVKHLVPTGAIRKRRTRRLQDDGGELHLDNALAGRWDRAFHGMAKTARRDDNVVSLVGGFTIMSGVDHEDVIWNAVQMIVVCEALENAGWRVELRGFDTLTAHGAHDEQTFDVMVKRPEEPLRADAVAAFFGHAGVYRTLGFGMLCASNIDLHDYLGTSSGAHPADAASSLANAGAINPVTLRLPRADSQWRCEENINNALGQLARLIGGEQPAAA